MRWPTRAAVVGCLFSACGQEFPEDAPPSAVVPDGGAGTSDGKCPVSAPFTDVRSLTTWLPDASILGARYGNDGRWYFTIDVTPGPAPTTGHLVVYAATDGGIGDEDTTVLARMPLADGGDASTYVDGGGTGSNEQAALSADGHRLLYISDRETDHDRTFRLYIAERITTAGAFTVPKVVDVQSASSDTSRSVEEPWFAGDRVYFSFQPSRDQHLEENVWSGTLAAAGDGGFFIDGPSVVGGVDSPGEDGHAVVAEDGSEIFFSSEREGGLGPENVWHAVMTNGAFGSPEIVSAVDGAETEYPTYLSPDRCSLYFIRVEPGDLKVHRLYLAQRSR